MQHSLPYKIEITFTINQMLFEFVTELSITELLSIINIIKYVSTQSTQGKLMVSLKSSK